MSWTVLGGKAHAIPTPSQPALFTFQGARAALLRDGNSLSRAGSFQPPSPVMSFAGCR